MPKFAAVAAVLLTGALCWFGATSVAQRGEVRQRAEAINREANELEERGRGDEAERLRREARRLLERAHRHEDDRATEREHGEHRHESAEGDRLRARKHHLLSQQLEELHAHARRLKKAGRRDDLERVHGLIREIAEQLEKQHHDADHHEHGDHKHGDHEHGDAHHRDHIEASANKLEHLVAAIEHLEQADMGDLAHKLRKQAEEMERAIDRERDQREHHPEHDGMRDVHRAIEELQAGFRRLHAEIRELHERLNDRDEDHEEDAGEEGEVGESDSDAGETEAAADEGEEAPATTEESDAIETAEEE